MKIFEPLVADEYEWVSTDSYDDGQALLFDSDGQAGAWKPIRVQRVVRNVGGRLFKASDFPWLGRHALVMRRNAMSALADLLEAHGEVLPLATDDGVELFIFNARRVDALDEHNSSVERFPNGRILSIDKVAFVEAAIQGLDAFRLASYKVSSTYVSERFIDRYQAAGLCGLDFNLV